MGNIHIAMYYFTQHHILCCRRKRTEAITNKGQKVGLDVHVQKAFKQVTCRHEMQQ